MFNQQVFQDRGPLCCLFLGGHGKRSGGVSIDSLTESPAFFGVEFQEICDMWSANLFVFLFGYSIALGPAPGRLKVKKGFTICFL